MLESFQSESSRSQGDELRRPCRRYPEPRGQAGCPLLVTNVVRPMVCSAFFFCLQGVSLVSASAVAHVKPRLHRMRFATTTPSGMYQCVYVSTAANSRTLVNNMCIVVPVVQSSTRICLIPKIAKLIQ